MPHTLFISDLHLSSERPRINQLFLAFCDQLAPQAEALYILGDLFEYWVGDDDLGDPFHAGIATALLEVSQRGVPVYLMHGNRDFLMGDLLAQACGASLLPDPILIDLYGKKTLLSHGDAFCTEDQEYMAFRRQVRDPAWQKSFLAKPLAERKSIAEQLRQDSEQHKQDKPETIMDVTPAAVDDVLRAKGYPRLIHGHTHRPARHELLVDGILCERWVLPDWYNQGGYLSCDSNGCHFGTIE